MTDQALRPAAEQTTTFVDMARRLRAILIGSARNHPRALGDASRRVSGTNDKTE